MYKTIFWTLWERVRVGWKNAIWENGIETYIIICETNRQSRFDDTGCSGLVHWDDPEGWDGEGGVRWVQDGEHMYTHPWLIHYNVWQNHYNIEK